MIKNIIFDIGRVLLDYNWLVPLEAMGLPHDEANAIFRQIIEGDLWIKHDRGLINKEETLNGYLELFPDKADYIKGFFAHLPFLSVPRDEVWALLPAVKKKGYKTYLLSNYPEETFLDHTKDAPFIDLVDGGVISYQVHASKPDPVIYNTLLEKYDLKPEECLFFDDRPENIEAAINLGFSGVVISSKEQMVEELNKLL